WCANFSSAVTRSLPDSCVSFTVFGSSACIASSVVKSFSLISQTANCPGAQRPGNGRLDIGSTRAPSDFTFATSVFTRSSRSGSIERQAINVIGKSSQRIDERFTGHSPRSFFSISSRHQLYRPAHGALGRHGDEKFRRRR